MSRFRFADGVVPGFARMTVESWPLAKLTFDCLKRAGGDHGEFLACFSRGWFALASRLNQSSVADSLNLRELEVRGARLPAWATVFPWDSLSTRENFRKLPAMVRRNRRGQGLFLPPLSTGRRTMNLDSKVSGQSHGRQILALMSSISVEGFWENPNPTDPMLITVLRGHGNEKWMVRSGTHRAVSALALGGEGLTAQVGQVVDVQEASEWPNVRNGTFSQRTATEVFERFMSLEESRLNAELVLAVANTASAE